MFISLFRPSQTNEEWNSWEVWQKSQPLSHFERCETFNQYLKLRPGFKNSGDDVPEFKYCFGEFSKFITGNYNSEFSYFLLLLDFYDFCKGFQRRVKGDASCIALLRKVTNLRDLTLFNNYDFNRFLYDYTIIHAHTVIQYSISTLIMRLVCHHLNFNKIKIENCRNSYENCLLGERIIKFKIHENIIEKRCLKCNRFTDVAWGKFQTCYDCHKKRICSVCGGKAEFIDLDLLPKCGTHCTKLNI